MSPKRKTIPPRRKAIRLKREKKPRKRKQVSRKRKTISPNGKTHSARRKTTRRKPVLAKRKTVPAKRGKVHHNGSTLLPKLVKTQREPPAKAGPIVPPPGVSPTDEALMAAIQRRRPKALAALYDRYSGILKALILRIVHNESEADDLLQEIFVEVWNHSQNFSAAKGKPLGWIVTLARRRAIDRLRKRQAYARAEERLQNSPEQQPEAWTHNLTEDDIDRSDVRHVLYTVLNALPVAQKHAIEFAYFKGMSQREIAAHTNIPLGTIKTRLELGLKKITEALKGWKDEF
jgi:RNA polymerase sigma-70 factor, ECF subfamily